MSDLVNSFECAGLTVQVFYDPDPDDPRKSDDNLGTMLCWHNQYKLGDKHNFESSIHFQQWVKQNKPALMMPVYLYDHSGLAMNTCGFHCPWDSGQVGWIYATREDILRWFGKARLSFRTLENARSRLIHEVLMYHHYLNGECYLYEIEDANGKVVDMCGGFLGDIKICEENAKAAARATLKDRFPLLINQIDPKTC